MIIDFIILLWRIRKCQMNFYGLKNIDLLK